MFVTFEKERAHTITAAHSGLARNTAEMRRKAEELEDRKIDRDEYDAADSLMRGRLQNKAFIWQSCGEVVILAVGVGILFALDVNVSVANNLRGLSVLISFVSGVWLLLATPWFWFEKRRPGQTVPQGMNKFTVGFLQLWRAIRHIWNLRQTLVYLVGMSLPLLTSSPNFDRIRLLPPRRLPEHNGDRNIHSPKHRRLLQYPHPHLPSHRWHRNSSRGRWSLLENPKALQSLHQKHVRCHHDRHHHTRRLGYDWYLDTKVWVPQ